MQLCKITDDVKKISKKVMAINFVIQHCKSFSNDNSLDIFTLVAC